MTVYTRSNALVGACMSPQYIKSVYDRAEAWQRSRQDQFGGPFPKNSCALVLDMMLTDAGFFNPSTHDGFTSTVGIIDGLINEGWIRIDVLRQPAPGWVFVCEDKNNNGKPDHVGLVIRSVPGSQFAAVDNRCLAVSGQYAPYVRNIGPHPPGFTPVDYWLAPPEGLAS